MLILKPIVGGGTGISGACGLPSAKCAPKPPPCALRFSAKPTRGPATGAHVLEPLHLTQDLCAPPGMSHSILYSLFCVVYTLEGRVLKPSPLSRALSPANIVVNIIIIRREKVEKVCEGIFARLVINITPRRRPRTISRL